MENTSLLGLVAALLALAVIVGLMLLFPKRPARGRGRDDGGASPDDPAGAPVSASSWPGFYYSPAPGELEEAKEIVQLYPDDVPAAEPSDVDTVVSSDDPEKLRQSLISILSIGMQVVDRHGRPLTTAEIDRFIEERRSREQAREGYSLKDREDKEEKEAAKAAVPSQQPAEEPGKPQERPGRYAESLSRLSALRANMAEAAGKN